MDEQTKALFLKQQGSIAELTIQTTILSFAVEALLKTHKNPDDARTIFDGMFGQFQAGPAWAYVSPEQSATARAFVDKLFSKTL